MAHLDVLDSRTGKSYKIPIDDGYIRATDIGKISVLECGRMADVENESQIVQGLRILDTGYQNTACVESSITFMQVKFKLLIKHLKLTGLCDSDGHRGIIRYRDLNIEQLFRDYVYEDVMHLLVWGHLPSQAEKDHIRAGMSHAMNPPESVVKVISAFPYAINPRL